MSVPRREGDRAGERFRREHRDEGPQGIRMKGPRGQRPGGRGDAGGGTGRPRDTQVDLAYDTDSQLTCELKSDEPNTLNYEIEFRP